MVWDTYIVGVNVSCELFERPERVESRRSRQDKAESGHFQV